MRLIWPFLVARCRKKNIFKKAGVLEISHYLKMTRSNLKSVCFEHHEMCLKHTLFRIPHCVVKWRKNKKKHFSSVFCKICLKKKRLLWTRSLRIPLIIESWTCLGRSSNWPQITMVKWGVGQKKRNLCLTKINFYQLGIIWNMANLCLLWSLILCSQVDNHQFGYLDNATIKECVKEFTILNRQVNWLTLKFDYCSFKKLTFFFISVKTWKIIRRWLN